MWKYSPGKAFPWECPFCGCGHYFQQETCDRCGQVVDLRGSEVKTFFVEMNVDAHSAEEVNDWLLRNLMEEIGGVVNMRWSIEEV